MYVIVKKSKFLNDDDKNNEQVLFCHDLKLCMNKYFQN